ncbi:MAG: M20 family metallopeptidase [Planctomycetota bacterium]|jgi:acetylornithine deacetylase/succinyl-diaminopimelate desuccinylase-like protein
MSREFFEKTLRDIVSIPSYSGREEKKSEYIRDRLRESGVEPQSDDDGNVWVEVGSGKGLLHVNAHIDTVVPGDGWESDPHEPRVEGDRLYGLGCTDCGGGLAALLWLAPRVEPKVRTIFSWTVCEEGIRNSKENGSARMAARGGDWAITAEPSCGPEGPGISLGTQGHARAVVKFPGKAAHSSRPDIGENAVYLASRFCLELEKLNEEFTEVQVYEDVFARPSVAATMIEGGRLSNIIPDHCQVTVSRRLGPGEKQEDFEAEMKTLLAGTGAKSEFFGDGPCAAVDVEGPLFAAARQASEELFGSARLLWQRGRTDAVLYALAGMDTMTVGPGQYGQSHCANEHIDLRVAADCARLMEKIINDLPAKD